VPLSRLREKNARRKAQEVDDMSRRRQEAPETTEWQQIGQIPVDTGRIVMVDPMNVDDVGRHEDELVARYEAEEETEAGGSPGTTYELVANGHGVAVALIVGSGLGDGVYPVEARFVQAAGALRVAEIRVRFLPHPVAGWELPR
jgi:hypothetical protein